VLNSANVKIAVFGDFPHEILRNKSYYDNLLYFVNLTSYTMGQFAVLTNHTIGYNILSIKIRVVTMNRFVALFFCLIVISIVSIPLHSQSYTTDQRSKAVHIVYDDSGSMIKDNGVYLDRWGQAKYAMEVFAVMLEEKDTMRVYYMSDFDPLHNGNVNAPARINMSGSEPPGSRVAKVHNMVTSAWNTPYDAVAKAYAELKDVDADEKWLVILTDGEFNFLNGRFVDINKEKVPVDDFFRQYVNESNVKIILLAMGDDAEVIKADPGRGIFFEQARNSNEILGRITAICNRIFNRNKLTFRNESRREFSFDVPMAEFFILAQGADIKVNSINGGGTYSPSETVSVRYSEKAATNFANDPGVIISRGLTGVVAIFRDIPKGNYTLDVSGAQTVEIYYKPAVAVAIKLYTWWGREIHMEDYPEGLPEGSYRIKYGLIDPDGKFINSSLLGNVQYEATVQNGGKTAPIKSGSIIKTKGGELKIDVTARFMDINTSVDSLSGNVLSLTPIERLVNFFKQNWLPLSIFFGIILIYLMYGPLKKKFPKSMDELPRILVRFNGEEQAREQGSFTKKGIFLPFFAEYGSIMVVPLRRSSGLEELKVRAKNNTDMILLNADEFSQEKLNPDGTGIKFRLNRTMTIRQAMGKRIEIPYLSQITTTFPRRGGDPEEEYHCLLEEGNEE